MKEDRKKNKCERENSSVWITFKLSHIPLKHLIHLQLQIMGLEHLEFDSLSQLLLQTVKVTLTTKTNCLWMCRASVCKSPCMRTTSF